MFGTKVNFTDMYGGTANVHLKSVEEYSKMYDVLEDFMFIAGDEISDMSAMIAAQKFSRMMDRLGYMHTTNSVDPATKDLTLNLTSGNISPSVESSSMDLQEIKLPIGLRESAKPEPVQYAGELSEIPAVDTHAPIEQVAQPSEADQARKEARRSIQIPGITPTSVASDIGKLTALPGAESGESQYGTESANVGSSSSVEGVPSSE